MAREGITGMGLITKRLFECDVCGSTHAEDKPGREIKPSESKPKGWVKFDYEDSMEERRFHTA